MSVTPVLAAILVPIYFSTHELTWGLIAFFLVCFTLSNMSITCGYHRYFSHRSYDVHPLIEKLYILVSAGAFQGTLLQWCTDHRRHHRMVDTDEDPYSINKGFWFAHMGWMLTKDEHPESQAYPKDLTKDPWIQFQHDYYVWIASFMGFVLPGLVGWALGFGFWGGVIIGGLLRIVLTQHSTFLINSWAHTIGRRTYTDKNSARDSLLLALMTFGEGYHNYHHLFQADYRNGIKWYHWDPTKWWIRALSFFGLAGKLKRAPKEEILKARIAMEEKVLLSRGACADRVTQLKARVIETQKRLKQLRDDYLQAKKNFALRNNAQERMSKYELLRAEIKMAKLEFQSAYGQWRVFRRTMRRAAVA